MPDLQFQIFHLTEPQRRQVQCCQLCSQKFGITTRQHLCKRCFRFVCDSCSPHKQKVFKSNMHQRLHRLCKVCHTESEILKKYVQLNKICWGQDSDLSKIWLKNITRRESSMTNKGGKKKNNLEYNLNLQQFWGSLNYSFRQLVCLSIQKCKNKWVDENNKEKKNKISDSEIYKLVFEQTMSCLSLLMSQLKEQIRAENVFYILVFFLVHSKANNAVILSRSLIEIIRQYNLSIQKISSMLQILEMKDIEIFKMENYFQLHAQKMVESSTINYFPIQTSIQIIGALFARKNAEDFDKFFAYIAFQRKQFITKNAGKPELIQIEILRNGDGLGEGYKKFLKQVQSQKQTALNETRGEQESDIQRGVEKKKQEKKSIENEKKIGTTIENVSKSQINVHELLKENEQLKIKNKNYQQEIDRLRQQNTPLNQTIRGQPSSEESFWQQIQQQDSNENNLQSFEQQPKQRKKKLVKRHKAQKIRKLSMSMTNLRQQAHINNNSTQNQKILYKKVQEVEMLKKQLDILKFSNRLTEQQLRKYETSFRQTQKNNPLQDSLTLNLENEELTKQNRELKKQVDNMKQMNKQLMLKLKQLTNMLMDKEQQENNLDQQQNFEDLVQIYKEQIKNHDQNCFIF